ncbi:MAG: fluoride efflux transporter CrcB [Chlorobiota bacterium]|nr:MAG: fluoride efflux transporter CrcB [Chlorobiota bacterium]
MNYILVSIGGAIGSLLRYSIGQLNFENNNKNLYLTFSVNAIGSLFIGIIYSLFDKNSINYEVKLLLATGFCGGFTTFSTFSIENINLLKNGNILISVIYIFISLSSCLIFTYYGYKLFSK